MSDNSLSLECKNVELFLDYFNLKMERSDSNCCSFQDENSEGRFAGIAIGCTNSSTASFVNSIHIQRQENCKQSERGNGSIPPYLLDPLRNITGLTISDCDLSIANTTLFEDLGSELQLLRYLNFSNSKMQAMLPAEGLKKFGNLEILDLSQNALYGFMPASLFTLPLRFLNLSGNSFTSPIPFISKESRFSTFISECNLGYGCYTINEYIPPACNSTLIFECATNSSTDYSGDFPLASGTFSSISSIVMVSIIIGFLASLVLAGALANTSFKTIPLPNFYRFYSKKPEDPFQEDVPLIVRVSAI